ncbi:hypothetical protein DID88_005449 [Monilinia fructigena]|uniref:Uncharacterized protein n=1 Tax=Monilinia fructigena TaxID=38457 RepID=A0A395J0Z9_9HELO|nr:hypothetical protein DID88_005449 [Monilinia fructigena]
MGETVDGAAVGEDVIGAVEAELADATVADEAAVEETLVDVGFEVVVAETDAPIVEMLDAGLEDGEIEVSVALTDALNDPVWILVEKVVPDAEIKVWFPLAVVGTTVPDVAKEDVGRKVPGVVERRSKAN